MENEIIKSSDGRMLLTSQRLIETTPTSNVEVFLKDIVSFEIVYKKQPYYVFLCLGFGILIVTLFVLKQNGTIQLDSNQWNGLFSLVCMLFLLAAYFAFFSLIPYLVVRDKLMEFSFNLDGFKKHNIVYFTKSLKREIEKHRKAANT